MTMCNNIYCITEIAGNNSSETTLYIYIYITTDISEEGAVRFWADFLPAILRLVLWGETELSDEEPGLAGISSSCNTLAAPVCVSNAARAERSLLVVDWRDCATGTDFSEDTGDDGFEDTEESGDLGSCVDFLVGGWATFGFFDCQ